MVRSSLPTIERTFIDGVPTIWSTAPGPLTAALVFRVGRADEPPAEGGLTHLVEHLAMVPLGQPRYDHNAMVEGNRTVFFATGSPDDVVAFLDIVTRALAALPGDRLAVEREILVRESDGRTPSILETHRRLRFGACGHGLVFDPEFGLPTIDARDVQAWSTTGFTRGNALLWLTGRPPRSLVLHLPDGPRLESPETRLVDGLVLPAHLGGFPGFAMGFMAARKLGAGTMVTILHRRLRQRLRFERGLVYDVIGTYEPIDADTAIGLVGTDCTPAHVDDVANIATEELDRLSGDGATEAELSEELADLELALSDRTAVAGLLDAMATDELLGRPPQSPEQRRAEMHGLTAGIIRNRAAEARQSMIMLAELASTPNGLTPYPMSSREAVEGREVKPLLSLFGFGRRQRLTIGPDGVTLREPDGSMTTIRYEDCIVLECPTEDDRVLWDRNGNRIYIPAVAWRGGSEIVAEIDAALPAEMVINRKLSDDLVK
jgi:predicted Zn-dependent peptidase